MRDVIGKAGYRKSDLVRIGGGGDRYRVRIDAVTTLPPEKSASVEKKFRDAFPEEKLREFKLSPGGDKITLVFDKGVDPAEIERVAREAGLELRQKATLGSAEGRAASAAAGSEADDKALSAEELERCLDPVCVFGRTEDNTYDVFLKGVADNFLIALGKALPGVGAEAEEIQWVGPAVGRQLRDSGIMSLLVAMGLILVYVAFRFDLRFAPGAVLCLFHDSAITIGIFTLLRREVSLPMIAALLTIIGYSINDTIVVYDRIRENLAKLRERELSLVIDKSINETLSRTIMTALTTELAVLPILFLARGTIQNFALALTIGIVIGTYSSIYIASPLSIWIDRFILQKRRPRRA